MFFFNNRYLLVSLLVTSVQAFTPAVTGSRSSQTVLSVGYVPDGLSPTDYEKIKKQDRAKVGKDLGRLGPRGFVSRSMQGWQEAYERGETSHTFAPINYRKQLQEKKIKLTDIPYMVRGGKWDNSDCTGPKKQNWLKSDKDYAKGGYKKEQSVSILGSGPGLNWTGERREDNGLRRAFPGFF